MLMVRARVRPNRSANQPKHTPPTATRDRLPAIDNQQPTVVEKAPALVVSGLNLDQILGGAVPVGMSGSDGGGPGANPTSGWFDDVVPGAPRSRGRGLQDAPVAHGGDSDESAGLIEPSIGGLGGPGGPSFDDGEPAEAPGLPHHRFDAGGVPQRKAKAGAGAAEAKPGGPGKGSSDGGRSDRAPEVKPVPRPVKASSDALGGSSGFLRDLVIGGAACLLGGGLGAFWTHFQATRDRDGAVTMVVESRELVKVYLDHEIAALEREVGDADHRLVEATKGMSPEPTVDELRRIEVMAREKAQIELLLEVMRARKRSFVEGVRNGGH